MDNRQREKKLKDIKDLRDRANALARVDFEFFLTSADAKYQLEWFHKAIAKKCQELIDGKIKNLMVFMPPQHGKAIEVSTPVLTANRGWTTHGDLLAGDIVFNQNGEQVKVQAVTPHYEWECRELTFQQGESIIASYNHEWGCYIPNSDHKAIFYPNIETDAIWDAKRDRSPYISTAKPLQYPHKDLLIDPYVLGLWLGDGCGDNKQICKSNGDCKFFLSIRKGEVKRIRDNVSYIIFDGLNKKLLRQLDLCGNKHIPIEYLTASAEQRLDLLCGLMDTDGHCDTRGNCEITQVNKGLALQIWQLVTSLGYKPNFIEGDATIDGRFISKKYRICFCPNREDNVFKLPRKLDRLRNKTPQDRCDKYKHFIKDIKPAGKRMVNCIQVEGGYYLVGKELRCTHNSQIISRLFPAFALGRNPDLKIIGSSYSADLAVQFARSVQRTIESLMYRELFPKTTLSGMGEIVKGYQRNNDFFEIVNRKGFYKAVGVGGSLTGTPVDIAIIDDPVKDATEANSTTYRQRVWDWYNTVLSTRLHNESKQLFIMTRWHEDDLAGRILKDEREEWEVLTIPAICEVENDGDLNSGRHIGEALWPERHSLDKLLKQQARAPREFAALYQQHPTIEGGNIVKRDWFQHISEAEFNAKRYNEPMHFYLDTAYRKRKKGQDNDPSGILAACRIDNLIYLFNAQRMWKDMPDLLRFLPEYMQTHGGNKESILHVEPKASGISVVQMLQETTTLNVKEIDPPTDDKETRLRVVSPRIECGRVVLVDGAWTEDFLDEVCGFPSMPHDEFVDILGYAINDLYDEDDGIDYDIIGNINLF